MKLKYLMKETIERSIGECFILESCLCIAKVERGDDSCDDCKQCICKLMGFGSCNSNIKRETGHCSSSVRKDRISVYFRKIQQEPLLEEIIHSEMSEEEKDNLKSLLLNSIRDNG